MISKMHSLTVLLDHEDFVSEAKPFSVPFIYLPSIFLYQTFLICQPIFKVCCIFCEKLNAQFRQENNPSTFEQLQRICEEPLSDTRKHTFSQ